MLLLALREKLLKGPREDRGNANLNDEQDERNYKPGKYFHFIIDQRTIEEIQSDPEFTEYIMEKGARFVEGDDVPFVEAISGKDERDILSQISPEMEDPGLERFLLQRYANTTSSSEYQVPPNRRAFHKSNRAMILSNAGASAMQSAASYERSQSTQALNNIAKSQTKSAKKRGRYQDDEEDQENNESDEEEQEDDQDDEDQEELRAKRRAKDRNPRAVAIDSGFDFTGMQLPESTPLSRGEEIYNNPLYSMPANPISAARRAAYDENESKEQYKEDDDSDEDVDMIQMQRQTASDLSNSRGNRSRRSSIDDYEGMVLTALLENDGDEEAAWTSLERIGGSNVRNNPYFIAAMNTSLVR